MRLRDNPVYRYGMKIQWRGWRLWLMPGAMLILLCGVLAVSFSDQGVAQSIARLFRPTIQGSNGKLITQVLPPAVAPWHALEGLQGRLIIWMAALFAPALSASIMAREYENRTIEALRITRLTVADIIDGKLWVAATPFVLAIGVSLPPAIMAVGMGGVGAAPIAHVVRGLARVWAYCLIGLWAGARTQRRPTAIITAYGCAVVLVGIAEVIALGLAAMLAGGCAEAAVGNALDPSLFVKTLSWAWWIADTIVLIGVAVYAYAMLSNRLAMVPGMEESQIPPADIVIRDDEPLVKSDGFARF